MCKIIITGGAGFIGGNFVQYLLKKYPHYKILNLDNLTYAGDLTKHTKWENNKNYKFVKADISDRKKIMGIFEEERPEYIVHFAAESHVDRSITNPGIFVETNVMGTQILLEAAKEYEVKKFIHVSTDEVYGELDNNPNAFFTESTPLAPNSPYSASKAASDFLVRSYYETYNLPINITRCSNNYGPFHFPEKLIPLTISRALNNQSIPIYGEGKNIRDWLHVHDHCSAIDLILNKGINGEVYNIGGHNEKENINVVKTILQKLNKPYSLIEFVTDRLGHDQRYAIDPSKLRELGWKPEYSFETGIEQTINWYLENEKWWETIINGDYKKYFKESYNVK